ncbi:MAG TPA: hypothetical protein VLA16_14050 [Ideonella sp.]|nr:hypothetical protein [Ideonella sp.]
MFQRHAHQFVALCLSALVTVSVMAGVNSMAAGQGAPLGLATAPAVAAAQA